jgi:iron(III) transport system permease protein
VNRTLAAAGAPHAGGATPPDVRRVARAVRKAPAWILVAAAFVSAVSLLPLFFVVAIAIQTGWATIAELVVRPRVGELLVNTVLLVVLTVPLCATLAVALAWLTERTDLPWRRMWSLFAAAPLAIPAFVQSYAWITLVPSMHGLAAGVFVSVVAYFPFIYLPAAAALRRLDPGIEDVAASLGLTPVRRFFRVVLPQLRLAILGGALLVALHLLAEYGLFALVRFDTFTTAIFDQFQSSYSGPAANMLAGILVLCCLAMLVFESSLRGRARYAYLGSGSPGARQPIQLGRMAVLASVAVPAATTLLALGVPLATLIGWTIKGGAAVWRPDEFFPTLSQTLLLAAAGALLTLCAALPIAWLSVRVPSRLQRTLESFNYVTSSLPGIVVALALVTITVRFARPIYQTLVTALLAYVLMFLPRALVSLRAGIAQAPVELEETARSLGRSPARALWATTLRLAAPGAAAGAALVFLGIVNELTATLLLAPNGTRTLATSFWMLASELDYAAAAPYALMMVALSLPLTWVLHSQSRRLAGR